MNSQYNIVIQWSGDKVLVGTFLPLVYIQILFQISQPSSLVLSIASAFSLVSPDWHLFFIYITTGFAEAADNEAELAGVLVHEIGHTRRQYLLWR